MMPLHEYELTSKNVRKQTHFKITLVTGYCRDEAILPGVRLGVIVLDTCDNPLYTAEQSLDLLQGFMYRKVKNIHKDVVCTKDSIKNILGIIGAQTSEVNSINSQ